jgi:hypothetical protein
MIKLISSLLLIILCNSIYAQQGVVVTGGDVKNTTGSISTSLGQVSYSYISNGIQTINQGIQQTYDITTSVNTIDENIHINVMPNPTNQLITLAIQEFQFNKYRYSLVDLSGKKLQSNIITSDRTELNLQSLPASIYMLQVMDDTQAIKTFKIIKTN